MQKIIMSVDGMKCAMCAKRINEGIVAAFKVKSVESFPESKQTVVIAKEANIEALKKTVENLGFCVTEINVEETAEKKSVLGFLRK